MYLRTNRKETIGTVLLVACFTVWALMWFYHSIFESENWGLIAGFFKGLVYGGYIALIPFSFAAYSLLQSAQKSFKLVVVLIVSGLWILLVTGLYLL